MFEGPNVRLLPTEAIATGLAYIFGETKHELSPDRRERLSERGKELVDELVRRQNALINTAVCDCPHMACARGDRWSITPCLDCARGDDQWSITQCSRGERNPFTGTDLILCDDHDTVARVCENCRIDELHNGVLCASHTPIIQKCVNRPLAAYRDMCSVVETFWCRKPLNVNGAWVMCDTHMRETTACPSCLEEPGGSLHEPCAVHETVLGECNASDAILSASRL